MDHINNQIDKIFEEAGVSKENNLDVWEMTRSAYLECMAYCSVNFGLSNKRVKVFDQNKKVWIKEIRELSK